MRREELWAEIRMRNAGIEGKRFADGELRKFFDLVWDMGYKEGERVGYIRGRDSMKGIDVLREMMGMSA